MNATVIALFNNKGGVGKTSVVYHLAWMYWHLGARVVAVDLDPQANLTAGFLDDEVLEEYWPEGKHEKTIFGCVQPLIERTGDVGDPHVETIEEGLGLLVGDMFLSGFEDLLSSEWPRAMDGDPGSFRVLSAFWRIMQKAADACGGHVILVDLGPNLGAINRSALISADYVLVPLAPDIFSLQGLRNLGPTLRRWREQWRKRLDQAPPTDLPLPSGLMEPAGYVVLQHSERLDRPVKAYGKWIARIPKVYSEAVKHEELTASITVKDDPNCVALLKHYRSLVPMAQEARKPIFDLRPADGAIGSHYKAVQNAYRDFEKLALTIADRVKLSVPLGRDSSVYGSG